MNVTCRLDYCNSTNRLVPGNVIKMAVCRWSQQRQHIAVVVVVAGNMPLEVIRGVLLSVFIVCQLFVSNAAASLPTTHLSTFPRGTQVKTIDSGILFTCTLNEFPDDDRSQDVNMYWTGPGLVRITATRGRVYVERSDDFNIRLYITKITESDAGLYTCSAQLPNDVTRRPGSAPTVLHSEDIRLFLYEDIQFADTPTLERHPATGSALLQCVATGQPAPEVTWRFNRRRIVSNNDKYTLEDQGLRIHRLDVGDNGTYECRAEVESHGNVKVRLINLDVQYAPTIVERPTADRVIKGQNATLRCRADANPPVTYEWFREQRITEMVRVKVRLAQGIDSYVIRDVSSADEGRYFCRATNVVGSREAPVDVRMIIPPEIQAMPQYVVKAEGSTLTLPCESTGVPPPQITWGRADGPMSYTDDEQLSELAKSGILSVQPDPSGHQAISLTIRDVRRSYAGRLACTARNSAGNDVRSVSLVVEYPPSLTILNGDQLGWVGTILNVTCTAAGLPVPSMNWFRGENYLTDGDTYRVTTSRSGDTVTSVLSISIHEGRSWAYGSYSCIAKNVHGYVTETAVINEAFPPDIARNVSVIQETTSTVTLSAVSPVKTGGLPVTTWVVHYENDAIERTSRTFAFGDVIHVTGLVSGTTYTFSLAAGNAVGFGPSVKFRVSLPDEPKPSPVVVREMSDVPQLSDSHRGNGDRRSKNYNNNNNNRAEEDDQHRDRDATSGDSVNTPGCSPMFSCDTPGEKLGQSLNDVQVNELDGVNRPPGLSTTLIAAVGTAGALVALLVVGTLIAVVVRRRRRRRNRLYKMGGGGLGVPVETYALVQPSSMRRHRQPGDPLPPPDLGDLIDDVIVVAATPCTNRVNPEQRRAWETMLSSANAEVDDVNEFDCYSDDDARDVMTTLSVGGGTVFRYVLPGTGTLGKATGYDKADDGLYHSADAVDDVIDRIDFSSRTSQSCATSGLNRKQSVN